MTWYQIFSPETAAWLTLGIAAITFVLLLLRRVNIAWVSLAAAGFLIFAGIVSPLDALTNYINWDVLAIYWGYGMLAFALRESGLPVWIANRVLAKLHKESHVIMFLCVLSMFLSSFMANPVVVLILAPLAIELATRMKSSLFTYLIILAVSSNMVTTVTMIADPPALIMATSTGMSFFEFYWFQSKLSLGSLSVIGLAFSLFMVLWQFRKSSGTLSIRYEDVPVRYAPLVVFAISILVLALVPWSDLGAWNHAGIVGVVTGIAAIIVSRKSARDFLKEFDWGTLAFLAGIFVVIKAVEQVGLLEVFATWLGNLDISSPGVYLALFVWLSVILSAFIDNVPYTILMLPVCRDLASILGISPFPFYFGMLVGTGIGGNLTPVGATANVLACGMLEKRGYGISLGKYAALALPFSLSAVLVVHLLIQWVWL